MKKLLGIVVLGLILVGNAYSETKFSEIKKALKEDSYGLAIPESFHSLNSPKAKGLFHYRTCKYQLQEKVA